MECLKRRCEKKEVAQQLSFFSASVNKDPYLKIRVRKGERTSANLDQFIYIPGETVEGQVFLELNDSIEVRALEVTLIGHQIFWYVSKEELQHRKSLHTKTKKFLTIHDLLWRETGTAVGKTLQGGRHVYPFAFFLPVSIPSTLKVGNNLKGARIKYEVIAKMTTMHGAKIKSTISEVFVSRVSPHEAAPEEFQSPVREVKRRGFLCGVWSIKCALRLPGATYTEGGAVPLDLHVHNNSGLTISEIQCILYQTAKVRHTITKHANFETPISRLILPVSIRGGQEESAENIMLPVPIPLEASSGDHHEKCMNGVRVEYYMKIILKTPNFAFKKMTIFRVPLCITTLQRAEAKEIRGCQIKLAHQSSIHEVFNKVVKDARELICLIKGK